MLQDLLKIHLHERLKKAREDKEKKKDTRGGTEVKKSYIDTRKYRRRFELQVISDSSFFLSLFPYFVLQRMSVCSVAFPR